jgi:hypothetical protein
VIPKPLRASVRQAVFQKADEHKYLAQNRVQNRAFLARLVEDPEVGGVLKEYLDKGAIKTYVKDGILNKYAKKRASDALLGDATRALNGLFKTQASLIEKRGKVSLYALAGGGQAVVATGAFVKWETALKQAIEFLARSKGLARARPKPRIALFVSVKKPDATNADLELAKRALASIGVLLEVVHL